MSSSPEECFFTDAGIQIASGVCPQLGLINPVIILYCYIVQEGTSSVRFVLLPDFSKQLTGSVRFGSEKLFPGSTRFGLLFSDASWLGPVRFDSFQHPVPAGFRITRFGSVRPVRFGFLFPPE